MSRLLLVLAITALSSPLVLCIEQLSCNVPKSFGVDLENGRNLYVYDNVNEVIFDRNKLAIYQYPGSERVNILIDDSSISFSARILPDNDYERDYMTYRAFDTKIAGTARIVNNELADCDLFLSRKSNEPELKLPKKLQVEIIHQSAACTRAKLCQRLGAIRQEDFQRARVRPFDFGELSVLTKGEESSRKIEDTKNRHETLKSIVLTIDGQQEVNAEEVKALLASYQSESNYISVEGGIQSTINILVDMAVAELVKKIQEENQGKIKIPDLNQNFSTGSSWWETTGEFNTFEGTFEDLTTLKRTEDAALSHTGLKFIASCGFGLSKAHMEYQKYKLRYGIIKVDGKLSATIDGVAIAASVAVDYNQKPCKAVLDDLRVSELGKIKVKMTGLGPLNKLLSKLVTSITKKWQEEIVHLVESKLRNIIEKHLNNFNCEKYRP